MGKTSKWFRGLFALRSPHSPSLAVPKPPKEKRRWSFVKSYREKDHHAAAALSDGHVECADHDNHLTAVQAEAAIVAAHAAAAVARFTCGGRNGSGGIVREVLAAVKIQAAFRGSLARKALRALQGVVKLQALVRGDIDRKRAAERVQRMQSFLHSRARVCAGRTQILHNLYWSLKPSTAHLHGPATPDKFESAVRSESMMKNDQSSSVLKRNSSNSRVQINGSHRSYEQPWNQRRSWTRTSSMEDETSIITSKCGNLFYSSSQPFLSDPHNTKDTISYTQSPSYREFHSSNSPFNSPQDLSASSESRKSPFTPTRSTAGSRSYVGDCDYYDYYPNYMAYTESSKAKVRSLSVPKQRPLYESSSSSIRVLHHGFCDSKLA